MNERSSSGPFLAFRVRRNISTTANEPYSRVKPINEPATWAVSIDFETASDVFNSPYTIQGCLPSSATSQPSCPAIYGNGMAKSIIVKYAFFFSNESFFANNSQQGQYHKQETEHY